jgi:hypothetical protein
MGESEHAPAELIVAFWQLLDVVWGDDFDEEICGSSTS